MFSALSKTSEFEVRRDDGTDEKGSTRTSFLSSGKPPLSALSFNSSEIAAALSEFILYIDDDGSFFLNGEYSPAWGHRYSILFGAFSTTEM